MSVCLFVCLFCLWTNYKPLDYSENKKAQTTAKTKTERRLPGKEREGVGRMLFHSDAKVYKVFKTEK